MINKLKIKIEGDKFQGGFIMKVKKFLIKIGAVLLLVVTIGGVVVSIKEKKESENAMHIVQIIGKRRDVTKDHTYVYELNYLVDKKNNTYTLYSAYKDGIKMNEIEELILKIKAFDLCDVDIK